MNRPTWVTTVAVLAIIFGCLGMLNSANTIVLPQMLVMQKGLMKSFAEKMPAQNGNSVSGEQVGAMLDGLIGPIPSWFKVWSAVAGLSGLALSVAYLYAAISLLQLKRPAILLFYRCSALAIVLALARGVVGIFGVRLMGINIFVMGLASVAFHVVLLLVTATNDKSAFKDAAANTGVA